MSIFFAKFDLSCWRRCWHLAQRATLSAWDESATIKIFKKIVEKIWNIELLFAHLFRSFWRTSVATLFLAQKNWILWRYCESRCLIKSDFKDTFHCKCISSGPVAKVSWLVKCCQSLESFTVRNLLLLFSENIFQPKIKICISQFAWSCSIGGWL